MTKNKVLSIALGVFVSIVIILFILKITLLSAMRINYIGIIFALFLITDGTINFLLIPNEQNKLFSFF